MINMADGSVVERIYLDVEANGVGGVPSGQPSIVDSDENGYIDRIYIGTDKGYLYKVNIPDDPYNEGTMTQCIINTDFDTDGGDIVPVSQQYHPIYASPTVYVEKVLSGTGQLINRVRIFFGTGDSPYFDEDINTSTTTYHFFAYIDECGKGECDSSKLYLDWLYELSAGHRVFASAFAAAGTIYFGTSTAETEDPCETSNDGEIIALNVSDGSTVFNQKVGNIVTPVLVEDKHLYIRTPYGPESYGGGTYNNEITMGGDTTISTRMWREVF
jgi:outer membrane protein assembly factor BamB